MNVTLPDRFISHKREWPEMSSLVVMDKEGKAFFHLYKYHDDPSTLFLSDLSVNREDRKQGIGNEILTMCEDVARQTGATFISLWVQEGSWMKDWYTRNGYQYLSQKEDQENNIWMKKTLETK